MTVMIDKQSPVRAATLRQRVTAYVELTKPRISTMVLISIAVAAVVASPVFPRLGTAEFWAVIHVAVGMFLVAASGNSVNMYLERYSDFLMPRTASRPLPDRRLSSQDVLYFAAITFGAGVAYLALLANWQATVCAVVTWILYGFVYTPLKTRTPLNTEVGAVAGAMPVLCGALATNPSLEAFGVGLFTMLLFWQFPHFMAIAWLYRDQYRRGGLKMLTVTEPTGLAAGRKAVITAFLTWGGSLLPAVRLDESVPRWLFVALASILALWYVTTSLRFYRQRDESTARRLLRVSICYLPLYMVLLLIFVRFAS